MVTAHIPPQLPEPGTPRQKGSRVGPWSAAALTLSLGLAITGLIVFLAHQTQHKRDEARIQRFQSRIQAGLTARLKHYEDLLRGAKGLWSVHPQMTPDLWDAYVRAMDLEKRHDGIKSLARVENVKREDLPAFLESLAKVGLAFRFRPMEALVPQDQGPLPPQPDLFILTFADPRPQNLVISGLEVGCIPMQRGAAERARDTGEPSLTGLLRYRDRNAHTYGVALFSPLYENGSTPSSQEARRAASRGWVSLALLLDPLFNDLLQDKEDHLALTAWDQSDPVPRPLYLDPRLPSSLKTQPTGQHPLQLNLAGRTWTLEFHPLPTFWADSARRSGWLMFLGGLVISLLLAAIAWALVGAKGRAQAFAEDMTLSLREALGRYLSHVENSPLGVIEWDEDFRIRAWNPAAERIFGYRGKEVLGQIGDGFLTAEGSRSLNPDQPFQALLPGGGGTRLTQENLRKDGVPIICNWYNAPVRDSAGRAIGVSSLVEDITERKRAEEALRLSQKLESLGVLAGGIAHDFNNLLTAIQGHAELALTRVGPDSPLYDNLKRIEATTHRAADLSRQMLAYSGRAKFTSKPVDVNQLVRDMADLLKVSIPKKVQLNVGLEPGLPATIGDQTQLQQVILNLVTNAAEAIGEASGLVEMHTRRVQLEASALESLALKDEVQPGDFICLEVSDTGSGMPEEVIARIFDPFFTTKFTGRGLGLSATAGILRSHGGALGLASVEGQGTTIRVYFPASDLPAEKAPEAPASSTRTQAGTVLVVDDEGIVRDLAVMALQPLGYELLTAQDGQEAVEVYEANPGRIKVVLMDMTMPRLDGLEAFRRIRALDPNARVILSSGYSEQEAIHASRELNPEGFLQKPYRIQELIQRVHDAVNRA